MRQNGTIRTTKVKSKCRTQQKQEPKRQYDGREYFLRDVLIDLQKQLDAKGKKKNK